MGMMGTMGTVFCDVRWFVCMYEIDQLVWLVLIVAARSLFSRDGRRLWAGGGPCVWASSRPMERLPVSLGASAALSSSP